MTLILEGLAEHIVVAIVGACIVAALVVRAVTSMVTSAARERSRREIAAYIAEGSISPEQGERLMKADISGRSA
ncbi:MAG: hypothetical protein ACYTG1_00055 [Planctomycetota bacterium]|jgi:hypothetical protein